MSATTDPIAARVPTPAPRRAPASSGRPRGFGVFIATVATFLVILSVLAWRMAAGEDPALGQQPIAAAKPAASERGVIDRRIVAVKVVHDPAPVAAAPEAAAAAPVSAPAPVTSALRLPPRSPPPAPAPAPAPAPVTSSS